jgi:bifunctional DNA-binding transcriptional regulator/antitoxin component of YhaV-PrlF toxin-antitoxin module
MKLQKSISRRLGDREYPKFQVAIPKNLITHLNWEAGDNLEGKVTAKGLLICKTEQKQPQMKFDYEQFKDRVTRILASMPEGCTWTELRAKAGLTQATPSAIWVKRMEDEGILKRLQDPSTSRIIWKSSKEQSIPNGSTLNQWLSAAQT